VHGAGALGGATPELAPGTGIFAGQGADAVVAAARAVASGTLAPLDVRMFVGRTTWPRGELDELCATHEHRPAAAARSIALKQCLGLPKPLWHEVRETCR